MSGILRPFIRKMRAERKDGKWWVMKKYHGYWFEEIPLGYKTKSEAEKAIEELREMERRDIKRGIW